ncbi:MAG: hypothetical protein ACOYL5_18710, partial [Phototrophicaceae bacterium]
KLYLGEDDDILAWWDALPAGEKGMAFREVLRAGYGQPYNRAPHGLTLEQESALLAKMDALPQWIEQALQRQMQSVIGLSAGRLSGVTVAADQNARLSAEESARKQQKMKRASW